MGIHFVPYLEEYDLEGLWIKPDSISYSLGNLRIVRLDSLPGDSVQTGLNFFPLPNPFQFSYTFSTIASRGIDSLSNKEVQPLPLYPFSVGADSLYNYKILSEITMDHNTIVEVQVSPKYRNFEGVAGVFQIDKYKKIVVGADYRINSAGGRQRSNIRLYFNKNRNHERRIKTRKVLYDGYFWLPETIEEELHFQSGRTGAIVNRTLKFDSYEINTDLPHNEETFKKPVVFNRDSVFRVSPRQIIHPGRLSKEEEDPIISAAEDKLTAENVIKDIIDSETITQYGGIQETGKKAVNFVQITKKLADGIRYNRVEGMKIGYVTAIPVNRLINAAFLVKGIYGIKDERWKGEGDFICYADNSKKLFLEGNVYNTITFEEDRSMFSDTKNSATSFFLKRDYRDYYYKKGFSLGVGCKLADHLAIKIRVISHMEETAVTNVKFSVFNHGDAFRFNPHIKEGVLRSISVSILYRNYHLDAGIDAEYTDKPVLHSDFSYSRISGKVRWSFRPTHSTYVYLLLNGGSSNEYLPPQKWYDFGGKSISNFYGNLRGVGYKAFTGDRMVYGTLEFSKILNSVNNLKATMWSGGGWSKLTPGNLQYAADIPTPAATADKGYHEFGIGISDELGLLRVDFIRNSIFKNSIQIGFNIYK